MKLAELLTGEEVTCWDTDYDMEFYMYGDYDEKDDYDRAMDKLSKCLEVTEKGDNGVTCKLMELIEYNLENEDFKALFKSPDIDDVMDDMEMIISGYCSESWYARFAEVLKEVQ